MYRNGKSVEHLQDGKQEFLQEFEILNSEKFFSIAKRKITEIEEYVSKNKKELEEELFKCEASFETQTDRLNADIKEMRINFSNLRIAHEKSIRVVANLCRDRGVDINGVRLKIETHGMMPRPEDGLEFDIEEMKLDL